MVVNGYACPFLDPRPRSIQTGPRPVSPITPMKDGIRKVKEGLHRNASQICSLFMKAAPLFFLDG